MTTLTTGWFVLGAFAAVVNYGIILAYFQHNWPTLAEEGYLEDCGLAALTSLIVFVTWPSLFVSIFTSGFCKYGLKYRRKEPDVRQPRANKAFEMPYGKKESQL